MTFALLALLAAAPARPIGRPALDELAARIVEQAEAAKLEAPVGVFVEGAPPVLARAFATALTSELAARKRGPTAIDVPTAAEAEAKARAADLRTLLRVTVQLEAQKLAARGDAIHTWVNFWAGATPSRPPQSATLAAVVDADAQVLSLAAAQQAGAPPAGPLKLALSSLARLSGVPAALAFGDVDGDGKSELVVLQEDGLAVVDLDGRVRMRTDLREVPPAASPSREPFGAVAVTPGRVVVSSSRKARPAVLTARGGKLEPSPGEVDTLGLKPVVGMNVFEKALSVGGRTLELPAPFTAASSRGALTFVVYPDGTANLVDGAVPPSRMAGVGAGSTLADLDGDGTPELLVSSTRYVVDGDELRVFSLAQAQALQSRAASAADSVTLWQGSTARGRVISALGADLDGDKAEEVVLGVWLSDGTGELLIARRAP